MESGQFLESRDSRRYDVLDRKIKALHEMAWRDKWAWDSDQYSKWLSNFKDGEEKMNAMYLLSKFMYFDNETIRELMVRIYEDLYKRPIIYEIRRRFDNTKDISYIESEFNRIREKTRFLSIGNPSESSAHLLYFFRQENYLKRNLFIGPHELLSLNEDDNSIRANFNINGIDRIVVLDDFCGSGNQATRFNNSFVKLLKEKFPAIQIAYYVLFAIEEGIEKVQGLSFDKVAAMFVLDETYKCFSDHSRFFIEENSDFREKCKEMCLRYGQRISKTPLGYQDCQMLLGFHHNTPNNTLPIFWKEKNGWIPIFKRFAKLY